ncbi:MAG: MFS transporter, partial [Marmoricola sp.]
MTLTASSPPTLRSFWQDLPREGKLLLSVVVFEFIGTGLVLPFAVVYLHEGRHLSLGTTGLLLGLQPLVGMIATATLGGAMDRVGARVIAVFGLLCASLGEVTLAFASNVGLAAVGLALGGVAFGVAWPASQTLVAHIVPSEIRQRYFGVNFSLLNLGIGLGGIIGGLVIDTRHLWTFQVIYLADAISFVPSLFILLVALRHIRGRAAHEEGVPQGSYREVLQQPAMKTLLMLTFVAAFVGYAQLNAPMPAFASVISKVSPRG